MSPDPESDLLHLAFRKRGVGRIEDFVIADHNVFGRVGRKDGSRMGIDEWDRIEDITDSKMNGKHRIQNRKEI